MRAQLLFRPTAYLGVSIQDKAPDSNEMEYAVRLVPGGYEIEAAIRWEFLGAVRVQPGKVIGISVAVHDVDHDKTPEGKMNLSFTRDDSAPNKYWLGQLTLEK